MHYFKRVTQLDRSGASTVAILHGVEEIDGSLADADVALRLEGVDDGFLMLFDGFVREFGDSQQAHSLQGKIP